MNPVRLPPGFLEKPLDLLRPAFLQQKRTECPSGYLSDMPQTAAEVALDVLPEVGTILFRGASPTDDVQRGEHRLGRARL